MAGLESRGFISARPEDAGMSRSFGDALAYVRPTFMLPAVGMSAYGALLAPATSFDPGVAALHAVAVGLALFVAHLRDGLIDGHVRGEEEPRLSVPAFRWSIRVGTVAGVALAAALFAVAGALAGLSILGLLALALLHAPYLDRHPVTVTVDYPVGIGLTIVGGYAAQEPALPAAVVAVAGLFVGLLSGIKLGIDALDAAFDRSIDKRTVPVALGRRGAERVAVGVFGATALATAGVALALRTPAVFAAAIAPLACLAATRLTAGERRVRAQMAATYLFAGLLFLGACPGRCAGVAAGKWALGLLGLA